MDGITMGAASNFSMSGKYRIATERTSFAMPETAIGYFNDGGSSYFLSRLPLNVGIYLGLTGARLKGFDVKKIGLATHFIASDRLEDLQKVLVEAKNSVDIEKALKKHSSDPSQTETNFDSLLPKINNCFDANKVETIYERLNQDKSSWALKTIETLDKMSPTSLKVCLRSLRAGKSLSLHDCLKMEYVLFVRHKMGCDLQEGIRAFSVDNDNKPKWNPTSISEVTEAHVQKLFEPLPEGDDYTFED